MHEARMTGGSRPTSVATFYLSKLDVKILARLGYSTLKEAYADIGQQLGVNPRLVKHMRDDFDPVFCNPSLMFTPRRIVNLSVHIEWHLSAKQLESEEYAHE